MPLEEAESARLDADDACARKKRKVCGKNTLPSRVPVMRLHGPKTDLSAEATLIPNLWMLLEDHGCELATVKADVQVEYSRTEKNKTKKQNLRSSTLCASPR